MKKRLVVKKACIGDIVLFERKENFIEGTVNIVREDSVIVEISQEIASILGYNTLMTVVNHSNYVLLNKCI